MAAKKGSAVKAVSIQPESGLSMSVRKIQNGFIVSKSGYVGKGRSEKYVNEEYFSATNPVSIKPETSIKFGRKK